jgi:hypothetical protein
MCCRWPRGGFGAVDVCPFGRGRSLQMTFQTSS